MADYSSITEEFENASREFVAEPILLRLYVAGTAYRSARAIERVSRICEDFFAGRYHLEVIDLYQHPTLAQRDQIVALPTLIKLSPLPSRRVVGDMSDTDRVLYGIGATPSPGE